MKTLKMILLAFVLLATACSQNTTTPTTPPANTSIYSIDSTYYFKINFNGQTLSHYSVFANWGASGSGYLSYPFFGTFLTTQIIANSGVTPNLYIQSTNVSFGFTVHRVGDTVNSPIGAYDFHAIPTSPGGGAITDLNTSKIYTMDSASTLLNITNTSVTGFTGVMSGKLKDGTTLIPFTASFCLRKM